MNKQNAVAMNFWKIHMSPQKDSSAHKCVGVDVGSVTDGFWFAVKAVMVFHRITTLFYSS